MYTTPLSTLASSFFLDHHLYADNSQLFFSCYRCLAASVKPRRTAAHARTDSARGEDICHPPDFHPCRLVSLTTRHRWRRTNDQLKCSAAAHKVGLRRKQRELEAAGTQKSVKKPRRGNPAFSEKRALF